MVLLICILYLICYRPSQIGAGYVRAISVEHSIYVSLSHTGALILCSIVLCSDVVKRHTANC